ncbi:hypothetical protein M5689_013728 [Euphorbia peplus]|nr:hypothetical protein M5689_013728 [Euphorbia peplus]
MARFSSLIALTVPAVLILLIFCPVLEARKLELVALNNGRALDESVPSPGAGHRHQFWQSVSGNARDLQSVPSPGAGHYTYSGHGVAN